MDSVNTIIKLANTLIHVYCLAMLTTICLIFNSKAAEVIACVGNSITYDSYPERLQALLGQEKYDIKDFGCPGKCALIPEYVGEQSYWNCPVFSHAFSCNPDIVILMLGSNDSKPNNWAYKEHFASGLARLANAFTTYQSQPKVYLCRILPAYENKNNIQGNVIKNEIIPIIDSIATADGYTLIDCFGAFQNRPELLSDGVHPNDEGKRHLAQTIYNCIANEKCYDSTTIRMYPSQNYSRIMSKIKASANIRYFDIRGRSFSVIGRKYRAPMIIVSPKGKRVFLTD